MIGIFGGTFDPIHYGHLRTALDVKQALDIDDMRLVPCRIPPHRDLPGASSEQRCAMLELALHGQDDLHLDLRELQRDGPSYMVDTLQSLRDEIDDTPLCLVLGEDAFAGLASWHQWERLIDLAHIVVMSRPGQAVTIEDRVAALVAGHQVENLAELQAFPAGKLAFCPVTPLTLSATAIRALLTRGLSPRYMLPDSVLAYIQEQGIYR